jgi:Rod binding domain-containing protein
MSNIAISGLGSAPETPQQNPRLQSAAHEFEASLMQEFLKPLQHDSLFADEGSKDDDDTSGSAGTLMSYGAQAMAKAISEHGGFGIAQKILDHFKATANPAQKGAKSDAVRF